MIIAMIFGAISSLLINAQVSFEDCKKLEFKPEACAIQKASYEFSQKEIFQKK